MEKHGGKNGARCCPIFGALRHHQDQWNLIFAAYSPILDMIKSSCAWTNVTGMVLMGGYFKQEERLWINSKMISRTPHCGLAWRISPQSKDAAGVSLLEMNRDDWDATYHNYFNWPWAPSQADIPAMLAKMSTVSMIHINISLTWTA